MVISTSMKYHLLSTCHWTSYCYVSALDSSALPYWILILSFDATPKPPPLPMFVFIWLFSSHRAQAASNQVLSSLASSSTCPLCTWFYGSMGILSACGEGALEFGDVVTKTFLLAEWFYENSLCSICSLPQHYSEVGPKDWLLSQHLPNPT